MENLFDKYNLIEKIAGMFGPDTFETKGIIGPKRKYIKKWGPIQGSYRKYTDNESKPKDLAIAFGLSAGATALSSAYRTREKRMADSKDKPDGITSAARSVSMPKDIKNKKAKF